jgi:hypothetical protein
VNEQFSHPVETENNKVSLVERLDPSIGELSSVMGAMMTELLRRTLRDSVRQIDDELEARAAQKLDATIANRLPAIEQSATEAATKAAREWQKWQSRRCVPWSRTPGTPSGRLSAG